MTWRVLEHTDKKKKCNSDEREKEAVNLWKWMSSFILNARLFLHSARGENMQKAAITRSSRNFGVHNNCDSSAFGHSGAVGSQSGSRKLMFNVRNSNWADKTFQAGGTHSVLRWLAGGFSIFVLRIASYSGDGKKRHWYRREHFRNVSHIAFAGRILVMWTHNWRAMNRR